ncbi:endonuclease/exonuclease/phosphatase family protein [Arthrobacter sp. HS15c]|uniref:endonuclease/exonuclease/phosphatase family protein n=1 Tax=Arthrobacter sp. HS15c TaxID=3230279 RepID=UPI003465E00F
MTASGHKYLAAAGRWLALLVATPVLALSALRAVPAEWPVLAVQLLSFTPWLAVPAAVAMVLALLGRSRWLQVSTAALLLCQVFWLFPFDIAKPATASGPAATVELKAMNINSEFGQADAARIVQLVRENGIGLLTIQEHSQALQDRLSAEGLDRLLPIRDSDPTDDAGGYAVYSRFPLEPVGLVPDTPFRIPTVRLTAAANGSTAVLEVTNVHALPPLDARVDQWRSDLEALARVAERPGNRLLIGDFNATYDHAEFRELLGTGPGLVDVGAASGSRLVPTWPMEGPQLPGITIDHLVTSPQVGSSGYEVHAVPGTDHAAVLATLSVPAG